MKTLKIALAAGLMLAAAPAFAQNAPPSDTVKNIVAKGSKLDVMGMVYEQTYKTDGTYSGAEEGQGGKWRADGKKICLTPDALGQEICLEQPDGKKPGETYEVTSDFGPMAFTIKP